MKRLLTNTLIAVLLVGFIGGCTNIQDDQTRTKTEGTLAGAGLGGAAGALIGLAAGGGRGAAIGAAIGVGAGSLIGYAVGSHIADKKAEYASREDWLDACIAQADRTAVDARDYNHQLESELASLERKSKNMRAAYKAKKISRDKMVAEKRVVDNRIAKNNERIQVVQEEVKRQQNVLSDTRQHGTSAEVKRVNAKISELNKEVSKLKRNQDRFMSTSEALAL